MVGMHMREENRVQSADRCLGLEKPLRRAATCVELKIDVPTIVGIFAILDKRSCTGLSVERRRSALNAGQRDQKTGGTLRFTGDEKPSREHCCGNDRRIFHIPSPDVFLFWP